MSNRLTNYRTITGCVEELKKLDSRTAITKYHVLKLVKENKVNYIYTGNRALVDFDDLLEYLNTQREVLQ